MFTQAKAQICWIIMTWGQVLLGAEAHRSWSPAPVAEVWHLILIIDDMPNLSFVRASDRCIYHWTTDGDTGNWTLCPVRSWLIFIEWEGGKKNPQARRTYPPAVSHHSSDLIVDEEFLCHVLHMLQGFRLQQRAAVFNPSTGFPRGGQQLEGTTSLLF